MSSPDSGSDDDPGRSSDHGPSFASVLASRRMCRDYRSDPVDPAVLGKVLSAAFRAPSAGNTASLELLALSGDEVGRYWSVTMSPARQGRFRWPGLLRAPVLVVPYVRPSAYVERYAEPDKAHTGLGDDADGWQVPYWWVDGGAAVMAVLLAAESAGLGALFFGQFSYERAVRAEFGVPDRWRAVGTIALGHRSGQHLFDPATSRSASAQRPRREVGDVVHVGSW